MNNFISQLTSTLHGLAVCAFLAVRLAGVSLAGWSLWWILMPEVPLLGIIVKKWGL